MRADFWLGTALALGAVAAWLLWLPPAGHGGFDVGLSPRTMPTIALIGVLVLGASLALRGLLTRREMSSSQSSEVATIPALVVMAIIVGGVALMHYAGFLVGGPLMILALMLWLGERRWRWLAGGTLLPVGLAWGLATHALKIALP
jgi:hypothetical protein